MGRRGNKRELYAAIREPTVAREAFERRWRTRLTRADSLARLVTADGARVEPFHRWLPFRQGFSPGLVRTYLKETAPIGPHADDAPILDPFSGNGTTVVECARMGIRAAGTEASPALAFLTNIKFHSRFPDWTTPAEPLDETVLAAKLTDDLHRAALMLAVARRHTADGRPNAGAPPLRDVLTTVVGWMRDDFRRPLGLVNSVLPGDARRLSHIEGESIGAILTSPPYLSRYDYDQITSPLEDLFRVWYAGSIARDGSTAPRAPGGTEIRGVAARDRQLPATTTGGPAGRRSHRRAHEPGPPPGGIECESRDDARQGMSPASWPGDDGAVAPAEPDAVREVREALSSIGERRWSETVGRYFVDVRSVVRECHRVLRPGATAWFVIGGARLRGTYVPTDLILAEMAEAEGFAVSAVLVARDLIHSRRKLGGGGHIAPRESVVVLNKV